MRVANLEKLCLLFLPTCSPKRNHMQIVCTAGIWRGSSELVF